MSLVRSQVPIHSATGAQCGDPGRIQTPVARVATACLVSRPRSLDLVARGDSNPHWTGTQSVASASWATELRHYLERPAGIEPAP